MVEHHQTTSFDHVTCGSFANVWLKIRRKGDMLNLRNLITKNGKAGTSPVCTGWMSMSAFLFNCKSVAFITINIVYWVLRLWTIPSIFHLLMVTLDTNTECAKQCRCFTKLKDTKLTNAHWFDAVMLLWHLGKTNIIEMPSRKSPMQPKKHTKMNV